MTKKEFIDRVATVSCQTRTNAAAVSPFSVDFGNISPFLLSSYYPCQQLFQVLSEIFAKIFRGLFCRCQAR